VISVIITIHLNFIGRYDRDTFDIAREICLRTSAVLRVMTRSINQGTKDRSWISTYRVLDCFSIIKRSHSDEDHKFNTYL